MVFSLPAYDALLEKLQKSHHPFVTIESFIKSPSDCAILLRHDVDRRPERSVALARIEAARGITSTFYFRVSKSGLFPKNAVKSIADMGHECGYHYEVLSDCNGEMNKAIMLFKHNLSQLRTITPIKTVSMHGAPLSPYNNQDFGDEIDFPTYDLLGDAVRTIEPYRPFYFTDTGGKWVDDTANLRDRVGDETPKYNPNDDEFEQFVKQAEQPIYISTHPERWPNSLSGKLQTGFQDASVNLAKRMLTKFRSK